MGQLVGSFIGIWLFAQILEWALFKRIMNDPIKGKVGSVLASLALAVIVWTLTTYGSPQYFPGIICYVIAALVWAVVAYIRGSNLRNEQFDHADRADLEDTFR